MTTVTTAPDLFTVPLDDLPQWPKPDDKRLDTHDVLEVVVHAALPEVQGDRGQLHLEGIHFEALRTGESGWTYRNFRGVNIFYNHPIGFNRRFKRIIMKKDRTIDLAAIRQGYELLREQLKVDEALRDESNTHKDIIQNDWRKLSTELQLTWPLTLLTGDTIGSYSLNFKVLSEDEVRKLVGFYKFINGLPTHEGAK